MPGKGIDIAALPLPEDEIHLRHAVCADDGAASLLPLLSAEECDRANRFRFDRDRIRYIFAHAHLRTVLASYVGAVPADLRFAAGPYGKPYIPDRPDVRFNLSHSDDAVLIAVTRGREVGIDIERIREDVNPDEIASAAFSPGEREYLAGLPAADRRTAFYTLWTLKEAYVKALGAGLSCAPDSFTIRLSPDGSAGLSDPRYGVRTVEIGPGWAAAVAFEGDGHVRMRRDSADVL